MLINIDKDSNRFLLLMILIDLVFIFCHIFFNSVILLTQVVYIRLSHCEKNMSFRLARNPFQNAAI